MSCEVFTCEIDQILNTVVEDPEVPGSIPADSLAAMHCYTSMSYAGLGFLAAVQASSSARRVEVHVLAVFP